MLRGVRVEPDREKWIDEHPPDITNYLWAFLSKRAHILLAGNDPRETTRGQDKKKRINARFLKEAASVARSQGLPLLFVIFYDRKELSKGGCREEFLKQQFAELDVAYIDTKKILVDAAAKKGQPASNIYPPKYAGHTDEEANARIAQAIAVGLRELALR